MAEIANLAQTVLMGSFLIAVVLAVVFLEDRRSYTPERSADSTSRLAGLARSPAAWIAAFLALVFGFGAGALLYVGGLESVDSGAVGLALAGAFALVLVGYLLVGVYDAARSRGRPNSMAVAQGATVLAMLFVAAIAARLLLA